MDSLRIEIRIRITGEKEEDREFAPAPQLLSVQKSFRKGKTPSGTQAWKVTRRKAEAFLLRFMSPLD